MSLPYFPMYPTDFEAKTSHLTLAEDGAYNRLLRICWMTPCCTMPADEAWIMRRARAVTEAEQEAVRSIIAEFFAIENGRYSNARLHKEWLAAIDAHERRKTAGAKGGKSKALKSNDTASSNAKAMPKQPEPEPDIEKEDTNVSSKSRASRLPSDWVLPKAWGDWAIAEGMADVRVRHEAEQFRDYWLGVAGAKGLKRDWLATWRKWARTAMDRDADRRRAFKPQSKAPEIGETRMTTSGKQMMWMGAVGQWAEVRE